MEVVYCGDKFYTQKYSGIGENVSYVPPYIFYIECGKLYYYLPEKQKKICVDKAENYANSGRCLIYSKFKHLYCYDLESSEIYPLGIKNVLNVVASACNIIVLKNNKFKIYVKFDKSNRIKLSCINTTFDVDQISCGQLHYCFIYKKKLYTFGSNTNGQTGFKGENYTQKKYLMDADKVSCGDYHTGIITDNKLYMCGNFKLKRTNNLEFVMKAIDVRCFGNSTVVMSNELFILNKNKKFIVRPGFAFNRENWTLNKNNCFSESFKKRILIFTWINKKKIPKFILFKIFYYL